MSCCKTYQKKKEVKLWKNQIKWEETKPREHWLTKTLLLIPSFDVILLSDFTLSVQLPSFPSYLYFAVTFALIKQSEWSISWQQRNNV